MLWGDMGCSRAKLVLVAPVGTGMTRSTLLRQLLPPPKRMMLFLSGKKKSIWSTRKNSPARKTRRWSDGC